MLCLKKQMSAFYEIEMDKILTAFSEMDRPVNLSYWNSGSEYKAQLKKILKFDTERDFFDYQYYIPECIHKMVADKLGFSEEYSRLARISTFSQSTLSIVTLVAFLSRKKLQVGIVVPAYFSVQICCEDFKVPYIIFDNFLSDFNATFDAGFLLKSDCDVF